MFRKALEKRRAVVPASGYYEWKQVDGGKIPHYIHPADDSPLFMAGLYEWWKDPAKAEDDPDRWLLSFTILTRDSIGRLGSIHDRMPLFLDPDHADAWLDPTTDNVRDVLDAAIDAAPALAETLDNHVVSKAVGNVRNNSPRADRARRGLTGRLQARAVSSNGDRRPRLPPPSAVLAADEWREREAAHEARADDLTRAHRARAARGEKHPVEDFLFTYYSYKPAVLRRWHPGEDVELAGAAGRPTAPAGAGTSPERRPARSSSTAPGSAPQYADARRRTSAASCVRRPGAAGSFGCFGLHEWAMVYRQQEPSARRPAAARAGRRPTPSSRRTSCAARTSTRSASSPRRPRRATATTPTRERQPALEQPGCLHAGMDLYKWAVKLGPLVPGELLLDTFAHAREIRTLDMQASPYDLAAWGYAPVPIETAEGKAEYVRRQRAFAERGQALRERLLAVDRRRLIGTQPAGLQSAHGIEPAPVRRELQPQRASRASRPHRSRAAGSAPGLDRGDDAVDDARGAVSAVENTTASTMSLPGGDRRDGVRDGIGVGGDARGLQHAEVVGDRRRRRIRALRAAMRCHSADIEAGAGVDGGVREVAEHQRSARRRRSRRGTAARRPRSRPPSTSRSTGWRSASPPVRRRDPGSA